MLQDFFDTNTKITFNNRPVAVPYNYRIIYKISQIILILGAVCKKGGCSTVKLHIISNALSSNNMMKDLNKLVDGQTETIPIVRFDPAITRAVNFAIADEIIQIQNSNSKLKLTDKGKRLYQEIMQDNELMIIEKEEICYIKDKLKDSVIDSVIEKWGENSATD